MQTYKEQIDKKLKELEHKICCKTRFYNTFEEFPETGKKNILYIDNSTGNIYIWNGIEYISMNDDNEDNYIKSVENYTELRQLDNYNPSVVNVKDFTYIGPDGNNYTTLGGLFKKIETGNENGGTIIVGNYIWERVWDKIHSRPEWWECGGYDIYGHNYHNKNLLSPVANISSGSLSIFHSGIYNDRDRIQAAIYVSNDNKNLIVEYEKRTYLIDKTISNYNPILGIDINGEHSYNSATIKRINSPVTYLADDMNAGDTYINVQDSSEFRVGQNLSVFSRASTHIGLGFDESALLTIIGIVGNTINVINNTPSKSFSNGDTVMLEVTLYDNRTYSGNIKYSNGFFDGNKANGDNQRYIQDWRYNYGILAGTSANSVIFDNLEFKDNPSENISASTGLITNCRAYNLDGSFFHYSMSDDRYSLNLQTGCIIENCYVDGVCLATDLVSGHCEAAITNSLHTENIKISNCIFKNCPEAIYNFDTVQPAAKANIYISNSLFENFKYIIYSTVGLTNRDDYEYGITITNNQFYNCGWYIQTSYGHSENMYKGLSVSDINISNNIFSGCRFLFHNVTNLVFSNNQVLFKDRDEIIYNNTGLINYDSVPELSAISLIKCSKININNNFFENQYAEDENLTVCISVPVEYCIRMKDSENNILNYYYEQGIHIKNNKILGFQYGINGVIRYKKNITSANLTYGTIGWEFSNNYIVLSGREPSTPGSNNNKFCGISAPSGCVVESNTIIQQRNDIHQVGVWGINYDPFPDNNSGIIGVIIKNNYIYMVDNNNMAITVGAFGQGFWNWNSIVANNIVKGIIDGLNSAKNYAANNITINTSTLPGFINPEIPVFQSFEWNKNNY